MRTLLLLTLSLHVTFSLHAQADWVWGTAPANAPFDHGESIVTDASGNSYVAGTYASFMTFGSVSLNTLVGQTFYVIKFDVSGNPVWGNCAVNSPNSYARAIALDNSGNIYVAGVFDGPIMCVGGDTLFNTGVNNTVDIFLCKFDPSGNLLWMRGGDGNRSDFVSDIAIAANGDCYVTGSFTSPFFVFGSDTLINPYYQSLGDNFFLARFDAQGNGIWMAGTDSTITSDAASCVAIDPDGNIVIAGTFKGNDLHFDTTQLTNSGIWEDAFLVKYDTAGDVLWAKSFGGRSTEIVEGLSIDPVGNIYVSGEFVSDTLVVNWLTAVNADTGEDYLDVFIAKFNSSGIPFWVQRAGGLKNEKAYGMTTDQFGNAFVCGGYYSANFTFASQNVVNADPTEFNQDIFLFKYDTNGNETWVEAAGGPEDDMAREVATDPFNACYMTGMFSSLSITLSPIIINNPNSNPATHSFVAKIEDPDAVGESGNPEVSVYPNPSSSGVFCITGISGATKIEVCDIDGRVISETETPSPIVDLGEQGKGIYFLRITTPAGVVNRKIVYTGSN